MTATFSNESVFSDFLMYILNTYFQNNDKVHEDETAHNIKRTIYKKLVQKSILP